MSFELMEATSDRGTRIGKMIVRGTVSAEEVTRMLTAMNPGGPLGELPVLINALELTEFPSEAREVAGKFPIDNAIPRVVVIESIAMRMLLSFVARMQGSPLRAAATEAAGLELLEKEWAAYRAG